MHNGKLIILGAAAGRCRFPGFRSSWEGLAFQHLINPQDTLNFSLLTAMRAMSEVFPLERAAEAYEQMMSDKHASAQCSPWTIA